MPTSRLPNFLIIGAPKSGTNSVFQYLGQHPDVFMPSIKEPYHLSSIVYEGKVPGRDAYEALYAGAGTAAMRGEASAGYLYDPTSPACIRETLGKDVKLICLLRNPAKAIYSLWGQYVRMRLESRDAETALLASFDRMAWDERDWVGLYAYVYQYADHLQRYLEHFPAERLKIYLFEEFFEPGLPQYPDLCRFLGIADDHLPDLANHNRGFIWKSPRLNNFLQDYYGRFLYPLARRITPRSLRNRVKGTLETWNKQTLPPQSPELLAEMERRLAPSVRRLETLLGRDLGQIWF